MKLLILGAVVGAVCYLCMQYAFVRMDLTLAEEKLETANSEMAVLKKALEVVHTVNRSLLDASKAQCELVEACLQREAEAQGDAITREQIMLMGPPAPLAPEHKDKGVSDATRRAAADYLNKPL